jgi:hypothetical protein
LTGEDGNDNAVASARWPSAEPVVPDATVTAHAQLSGTVLEARHTMVADCLRAIPLIESPVVKRILDGVRIRHATDARPAGLT